VRRVVRGKHENRFRQIEFASHRLHPFGLETDPIREYGQRISAEDLIGENVQCVKDIPYHAGLLNRRSQAVTLTQNTFCPTKQDDRYAEQVRSWLQWLFPLIEHPGNWREHAVERAVTLRHVLATASFCV
jgi:hypothetical protein